MILSCPAQFFTHLNISFILPLFKKFLHFEFYLSYSGRFSYLFYSFLFYFLLKTNFDLFFILDFCLFNSNSCINDFLVFFNTIFNTFSFLTTLLLKFYIPLKQLIYQSIFPFFILISNGKKLNHPALQQQAGITALCKATREATINREKLILCSSSSNFLWQIMFSKIVSGDNYSKVHIHTNSFKLLKYLNTFWFKGGNFPAENGGYIININSLLLKHTIDSSQCLINKIWSFENNWTTHKMKMIISYW